MSRAGYVLVGGASSRMGRDKALLHYHGVPLAAYVAGKVREAAGSAVLVGDPARYGRLGFPAIEDVMRGCGPLGGIYAALVHSTADWNLIVACDMPRIHTAMLAGLVEGAERAGADCFIPAGAGGIEPLCAVYHRRAAARIGEALAHGVRKVAEAVAGLDAAIQPWIDDGVFQNCNTPDEWAAYNDKTREEGI